MVKKIRVCTCGGDGGRRHVLIVFRIRMAIRIFFSNLGAEIAKTRGRMLSVVSNCVRLQQYSFMIFSFKKLNVRIVLLIFILKKKKSARRTSFLAFANVYKDNYYNNP